MLKNQALIIIIGILLIYTTGCQSAKTSSEVSNSTSSDRTKAPNSNSSNHIDDEIASEVQSKLKANIPNSNLVINVDNGNVIVTGTIASSDQVDEITTLVTKVKGVTKVTPVLIVNR